MAGRTPRWMLVGGDELVNVHSRDDCHAEFCCIHHFSDHHMAAWPQRWRNSRMHRECEHGDLHPDPDARSGPIHVCDGCCIDPLDRLSLDEVADDLRDMIKELSP